MKILTLTNISVTIELTNNEAYFSQDFFDVYLNNVKVKTHINTNVFSLYNLLPDTKYLLKVNEETIEFATNHYSKILTTEGIVNDGKKDVTLDIQRLIDKTPINGLLIITEGNYLFTSLFLKSNTTIYLKKGALLSASTKEDDYKEFPKEENVDGVIKERGTWEGDPWIMKHSMINIVDATNINLIGEGEINGNAEKSTWWEGFREKRYARPHLLFINNSNHITVTGINFRNSPQWTIHPYFSEYINLYDFEIENPKISPNTDGINPQCSKFVNIIGIHFSVGDDCVALKSGKIYLGKKYKKATEEVIIRNCLMQFGHGAIVLGSEMSGGIKDITVERCIFDHTDRGLRIKTRRGRGNTAIIDGVVFNHIVMKNVLTPLVINMFYFCDPDGKTEYVYSKDKNKFPIDERTPYLGKFTFSNIDAIDCEYCAGYFYGLPEQPVGEINIFDSSFSFKAQCGTGNPAMMSFAEECSKQGFIFNNVKKVNIKNVDLVGIDGDFMKCNSVLEVNKDGNH